MQIDFSLDDARLVQHALERRVEDMRSELVRTDKHELQHSLAVELARLERIEQRLSRTIDSDDTLTG